MKLIALSLLFAGIIAATYGDQACLNAQVQECVAALQAGTDPSTVTFDTVCQKMDDLDTCLTNALKACSMGSTPELTAFIKALKDVCTPDSELNKKYQKNKECLNSYAEKSLTTSACLKALQDVIKEVPTDPTADKLKEYAKKLCGALSKFPQCIYSEVENACNKESREVVQTVIQPYFTLVTKNCESLGGGAGNSALSWTLLAAASLLFVLWH